MKKTIFRITSFFLISLRIVAQETDGESYRPATQFFAMLDEADSLTFVYDFEYPFMLVISEEEKGEYIRIASVIDRKAYIKKYIQKKNRNPLLPVNYWMVEFWGRISYARRHFRISVPPFFDERGIYCIKYGIPDRRYEDRGGLKFVQLFRTAYPIIIRLYGRPPPEIDFVVRSNETWRYDYDDRDIIVHFVEEGKGYRKAESLKEALRTMRERNVMWQWMELMKEREDISAEYGMMSMEIHQFEDIFRTATMDELGQINMPADLRNEIIDTRPHRMIYEKKQEMEHREEANREVLIPDVDRRYRAFNKLDFDLDVTQFKHDGGKTRVEIVPLVPLKPLIKKRQFPGLSDTMKIEYQCMIRNQEFRPHFNVKFEDKFLYSKIEEKGIANILCKIVFPLEPMMGELTAQITDVCSFNRGFKQRQMTIRDYGGDSLMISDIQLHKVVDDEALKALLPVTVIEGTDVYPNPHRKIDRSDPVYCYFEVYNLFSLKPSTSYELEITVEREAVRKGLFNLFRSPQEYKISMTHTMNIDANDSHHLIALNVGALKRGEYSLEITVIQPVTGRLMARTNKQISIVD